MFSDCVDDYAVCKLVCVYCVKALLCGGFTWLIYALVTPRCPPDRAPPGLVVREKQCFSLPALRLLRMVQEMGRFYVSKCEGQTIPIMQKAG